MGAVAGGWSNVRAQRCGFFPGGVRILYIRSEPAGSSSIDAAPVTGSLLFYAPVCSFAICDAPELSLSVSFGGTLCILLVGLGYGIGRYWTVWTEA